VLSLVQCKLYQYRLSAITTGSPAAAACVMLGLLWARMDKVVKSKKLVVIEMPQPYERPILFQYPLSVILENSTLHGDRPVRYVITYGIIRNERVLLNNHRVMDELKKYTLPSRRNTVRQDPCHNGINELFRTRYYHWYNRPISRVLTPRTSTLLFLERSIYSTSR
jgi:hypothetical protein